MPKTIYCSCTWSAKIGWYLPKLELTRTVCHPPLFLIIYIRCHHCGCFPILVLHLIDQSLKELSRSATQSHRMPPGGIKAMRASALPMRNLAISVGTLDFKELPLRAKSAKKLEPSDDSNFNTLGVCSLPCDRSQTPLGRKGKHACFSKADAKVRQKFHICKYFAKKHAFFGKNCRIVQNEDIKRRGVVVQNYQKLPKITKEPLEQKPK